MGMSEKITNKLKDNNNFDNSYLVITSDHPWFPDKTSSNNIDNISTEGEAILLIKNKN